MSYSWAAEDPIGKAIDDIATELNKKAEGQKWKKSLEENLYDTVGSVQCLSSLDWVAMGIPLRVMSELRRSYLTGDRGAQKERTTPALSRKQEMLTRKKSPREGLGGNVQALSTPLALPYPDLSPFLTLSSSGKMAKKDSKTRAKKGAKEKGIIMLKSSVNIVGKENFSTIFYNQLQGAHGDADLSSYSTQVSIFGEPVKVEFFDGAKNKSDHPSATILIFSKLNTIKSLSEVNERVQLVNQKLAQVPIILVAYDPNMSTILNGRVDWIRDLLDKIKPIRFFDIKSHTQLPEVIRECGLVAYRDADANANKVELLSKIQKAIDKKATEISLKKASLSVLPNLFCCLSPYITKLSLDSNSFKAFPRELLEFERLQELSLNGNQLVELPASISRLQSLVKLDLDNNNIDDLPILALKELKSLQELKVKANPLTKLPEQLSKAKDLLLHIKQYEHAVAKFKIFGVPLPELMENERSIDPSATIPRIVRSAANFIITHGLHQEGVFRLAGQNVACAQMKEDFDKGAIGEFSNAEPNVHNVTSLLKQFLRELPEPVLLFENYQPILSLVDLPERSLRSELMKVLAQLPIENYHLARTIFRLMYFVACNSEINRMDAGNVSKVVIPNLIYSQVPKDPFETMSDVTKLNDVLTTVTLNYPSFFEQGVNLFEFENLLPAHESKIAIVYRVAYGHLKSVMGTAISSDLKYLWSGDSRGILRLSTTADLTHIKEIDTTKKRVNCLTQCKNKLWVGLPECLQIRDETTGELLHEIDNSHNFSLTTIEDDVWIGDANRITIFDGSTYKAQYIPTEYFVLTLAQVEQTVWGGCSDKKIRVWAISTKELIHEFDCPQGKLNSLSYINGRVWSCSDDASICVWDVEKRELIERLENKHTSKVFGAIKVGGNVWTYSWDGIRVYNAESLKYVGDVHSYHHDAIGSIQSVYDAEAEHHKVFTGSWDQSVICWLVE